LAQGINMAGDKEILGLWIAHTQGAKFLLQVLAALKSRCSFPSDESLLELLFLALNNHSKNRTIPSAIGKSN
jgi:transposase-like protein